MTFNRSGHLFLYPNLLCRLSQIALMLLLWPYTQRFVNKFNAKRDKLQSNNVLMADRPVEIGHKVVVVGIGGYL